jgi:hypothetical protein
MLTSTRGSITSAFASGAKELFMPPAPTAVELSPPAPKPPADIEATYTAQAAAQAAANFQASSSMADL